MKWECSNKRLISDSDVAPNETPRDIDDANCAILSKFGANEWELVSVDNGIAYFKRPLRTKSEAEILAHFDKPQRDRSSLV